MTWKDLPPAIPPSEKPFYLTALRAHVVVLQARAQALRQYPFNDAFCLDARVTETQIKAISDEIIRVEGA